MLFYTINEFYYLFFYGEVTFLSVYVICALFGLICAFYAGILDYYFFVAICIGWVLFANVLLPFVRE